MIVGIATVLVLFTAITGLYLVLSAVTPGTGDRTPVSAPPPLVEDQECENCLTIEDARLMAPDADALSLVGSPTALIPPRAGDAIS